MNHLLKLLIVVMLVSCNKTVILQRSPPPGVFLTYIIPKGEHFSSLSTYKAYKDSVLRFTVRFDSSAIYTTTDPANQGDINKLYGFSEEGGHHENSARFGWNWENKKLNLFAYCYVEGERQGMHLASIDIGIEYACSIKIAGGSYIFEVSDRRTVIPRFLEKPIASGYLLYPYFGGDETAPHEIRIFLRP